MCTSSQYFLARQLTCLWNFKTTCSIKPVQNKTSERDLHETGEFRFFKVMVNTWNKWKRQNKPFTIMRPLYGVFLSSSACCCDCRQPKPLKGWDKSASPRPSCYHKMVSTLLAITIFCLGYNKHS